MKIGFDISQTGGNKAGCGFFASSIIKTLERNDAANNYVLLPTFGDSFWCLDWSSTTFLSNSPRFSLGVTQSTHEEACSYWNSGLTLEQDLAQLDIIHSNNFFCPPHVGKARLVYTLYDLSFLENPDWTTEANRISCFNGTYNASLYADYVIAISEFTRNHFLSVFPNFPAERISVIYPASRLLEKENQAVRSSPIRSLEPGRFWLTVGTIEPRKNLSRLLEAYAQYCSQSQAKLTLAIAGGRGWMMAAFEERIRELGLRNSVKLLGYVNDAQLQWLYEKAYGFVYPSLFEGFGLPVVEAMSRGTPVVAANTTSIPEIVGHTGVLVDPHSTFSISDGMLRLETESGLRAHLIKASVDQAKKFSWDRAGEQVVQCYKKALSLEKRQ